MISRFAKKLRDAFSHHLAYVRNSLQLLPGRGHQGVEIAKVFRERSRRAYTHMQDAKAEK
jgi:hypothetical protein